jgi:hypothetical protein
MRRREGAVRLPYPRLVPLNNVRCRFALGARDVCVYEIQILDLKNN